MKYQQERGIKLPKRGPAELHELMSWQPAYRPQKQTAAMHWAEYNEAQTNEKLLALDLLQELCSHLPETPNTTRGRPKVPMRDTTFCAISKLYEGLSSRRLNSDLVIAQQRGLVNRVPHFNTLLRHMNDPNLTPLLVNMIELSAIPLANMETTFAIDATGLSPAFYTRWLDERIDKRHPWLKIHVVCGVKSNIVVALKITDGNSNDSPHFPELVMRTAERFKVKEIMADMGYIATSNLEAARAIGAVPYIPFKINQGPRIGRSDTWTKLFYYFHLHQEEFMERYHLRSNIESTFSSIKRKFSNRLMLKNEIGQVNEALCLLLCHNLTVVVRMAFENGAVASFNPIEKIPDKSLRGRLFREALAAPKIDGLHQ